MSFSARRDRINGNDCLAFESILSFLVRPRGCGEGVTSQTLLEPVRRFVRNKQLIDYSGNGDRCRRCLRCRVISRNRGPYSNWHVRRISRKFDECHSEPARLAGNGTTIGGLLIGLFVYYFMPGADAVWPMS